VAAREHKLPHRTRVLSGPRGSDNYTFLRRVLVLILWRYGELEVAKLTCRCTLAYTALALALDVSHDFHASRVVAPFDLCHMMTSRDHANFRFLRYGVPKNFI